jgi:geranylgeranyl diphosphate synthase type II
MPHSYNHLLQIVEETIKNNPFKGKPENLYDPLNYILGLGGKRIRPVLTLMSAELFSDSIEKAVPSAIAVELFHNFSLIHDDIMDKAPLRRGQSTVHIKWDTPTGILSGDLMLVKAYEQLMLSEQKYWPALLTVFNKTASDVCDGQQMDMNFETQKNVLESDYLEMIKLKTSVLLGCSLKMGAIVADAEDSNCSELYNFGVNLGMGFQLMDDYLDAFGTPELVGKQPGGDILSDKKTIMFIHAQGLEPDILNSILAKKEQTEQVKIENVKSLFVKTGADTHLKNLAVSYFNEATLNLKHISVEDSKKVELEKLLVYLQSRTN